LDRSIDSLAGDLVLQGSSGFNGIGAIGFNEKAMIDEDSADRDDEN